MPDSGMWTRWLTHLPVRGVGPLFPKNVHPGTRIHQDPAGLASSLIGSV
jgi:hypothetical protein